MFTLKRNKKSSREQINIQGVENGILSLPGRKNRAVLEITPINFALKSDREQEAIIDNFQSFLNSLSTPIQIIMRARSVDMDEYTKGWTARAEKEENDLFKKQIENYTKFVNEIVADNKILTRRFYVVVPDEQTGSDAELSRQRIMINCEAVSKGLGRMNIKTRLLEDIEVLDLFYSFYSPKKAKVQPLSNLARNVIAESL